jgi:hypothetical protein
VTPALYAALACTCDFQRVERDDRLPTIVRFLNPTCTVHEQERL